MTGIVLALVTSVAYGASDFFGALAARGRGAVTGTTFVYGAASVVAILALAFLPWVASPGAVLAGTLAGALSIVGFIAFYASLSIGPMSALSPTIALINTLVPIVAALVLGETLSVLGWAGVALALVAGAFVAAEPRSGQRVSPRGLTLAVIAGLLLGAAVVALDSAPADAGVFPAFLDTTVGFILIVPLALLARSRGGGAAWLRRLDTPDTASAPVSGSRFALLAGAGGALLGLSNVLLVLALQSGDLAVVSVLVNLYPAVTVLIAVLVLRERLAPLQITGVALALVAATLLSLS